MKIKKDKFDKRWYLTWGKADNDGYLMFRNDWKQFKFWDRKVKWNWYNFALLNFEVMNDYQLGAWEVNIALLGLGFFLRHTYTTDTPLWRELNKEVKLAKKNPKTYSAENLPL